MPGNRDVECSEDSDEFLVVFVVIIAATDHKRFLRVTTWSIGLKVPLVLTVAPSMKQRHVQ